MEAMSCGRVPVVSEFTGCSETFVHGVNGFVLEEAGSAPELAALLDGPLADADRRAAIGARAVEHVQAFSWSKIYPRLLDAHRRAFDVRQARLRAA
jgi:glycosyltransferase involved in cell wall biosynthesis